MTEENVIQSSEFIARRSAQIKEQNRVNKLLAKAREQNKKAPKKVDLDSYDPWQQLTKFLMKEIRRFKKMELTETNRNSRAYLQGKRGAYEQILEFVQELTTKDTPTGTK